MHAIFRDIKRAHNDSYHKKTFQGINFQELLSTDNILIIAKNAKTANDYLHLIEKESEYLYLKLNHGKSSYISFNGHKGHIHFRNGENISSTQEITYLETRNLSKNLKHNAYTEATRHFLEQDFLQA